MAQFSSNSNLISDSNELSIEKGQIAYEYFLGKNGKKRINCAQAFASAFIGEYGINDQFIKDLKKKGVGKAPEGQCGIYYFGDQLLQRAGKPEHQTEFAHYFHQFADSLSCKELRKHKIPYCAECLKKSVDFVAKKLES